MRAAATLLSIMMVHAGSGPKSKIAVEIASPNKKYTAIFSAPLFRPKPRDTEAPWQKLELRKPGGLRVLVTDLREDQPGVVMFPYPDEERWSPDGMYMVVVQALSVSHGQMGHQVYQFLDVAKANWVVFEGGGLLATTDTFAGWKAGKPHTMLLQYLGTTIEAEPPE